MNLKQKSLQGLSWSFVDNSINQLITFLVGLVLARLINPSEFGIVGLITIFIAISTSFADSGFGSALIRKTDCTPTDYSTVFYFNLMVSGFAYLILYLGAPAIASFFDEPRLTPITRISSLTIVAGAVGTIQRVLLTKDINFKTQAKITTISSVLAGVIAIALAYKGMGVWSLVWRNVIGSVLNSLLLWLQGKWRPLLVFSKKSFNELFGFGSKLLISGLIDTLYRNIYYPIIGKCFSSATLGFYSRAETFSHLFSNTLTANIQRVSYPILASIQDDMKQLKAGYRKIIKSTMLVTFTLMLGLAAVAKPLIIVLIGEKWLPCVPYLQLMCFSSMLYPLHAINLNAINVRGRSDLFLKLEIIKKSISVPLIFVGIYFGVEALLIGRIITSVISYFLNSYYSATLINYPTKEQLADILPLLLIASCVSLLVWGITFCPLKNWFILFLQISAGMVLTIGAYELIRHPNYKELKQIILDTLKKISIKSGIR